MPRAFIVLVSLLSFAFTIAATAPPRSGIELVNSFPAVGPAEIAGSVPANKVLRAMQDHAAPPVTDVLAQQVRQALGFALDVPVALQRRTRHGGTEGHRYVAQSGAGGRALLFAGSGSIVVRPLVTPDAEFEPWRELAPVALVARMPMVLIAARNATPTSMQRLIVEARNAPGRLHLGSSGEFTMGHLTGELFKRQSGAALVHVAYNGAPAAARGVAAGQIEAAFIPLPSVLSYAGNERLRALAVADIRRHPALHDVPTLGESGVTDIEAAAWYGVFASARTPLRQRIQMSAGIAADLGSQGAERLLTSSGLRPAHLGPHEFSALIADEIRRWAPLIDAVIGR